LAQMDFISRKVKDTGSVSFFALCHELGMTREVIIVTFLAILELVRRHRVEFEQADIDDDIRLFPFSHSAVQG
ncbi:MAG TPA: segregation/condensation protein A, partial [Candidatus Acidoferrum sp.]|nr:segregation/condensation protein A [Candidatus Acidoferrum sp.]